MNTPIDLSHVDIEANLSAYLGDRNVTDRYASFDYCFNHFQSFRDSRNLPDLVSGEMLERTCLHLGFYLASWGMLRGSTKLLTRSVRYLVPVVEAIVAAPSDIWGIDADRYSDEALDLLLQVKGYIRNAFPDSATDTLVSKVMLGVFGCVPAFDDRFRTGFRTSGFGRKTLKRISSFYAENVERFEQQRVFTLDFGTGKQTSRAYTKAKLIDMVFFIEGAS